MDNKNQEISNRVYADAFAKYGEAPESLLWSADGQTWRFEKLIDLMRKDFVKGESVLDVGCGLGDFFSICKSAIDSVDYVGVDVVPELIGGAKKRFPEAVFSCRDIVTDPYPERAFDYGVISGVFNGPFRDDAKDFMVRLLSSMFSSARKAIVFNFTSTYVNFLSDGYNYFDPGWVLEVVATNLSAKIEMQHHYRNCDVVMKVLR